MLPVSARHGLGVAELKREIADRVAAKKATRARLEADVRAAATRLDEACGDARTRALSGDRVAALEEAFAEAAGVPTVVEAVERSTRMRAGRATGWPVVAWFSRLRPDPLKRLHLDLGDAGRQLTGRGRTSVPAPSQVQRARVDAEVRALADDVSSGLARPWSLAVRRASTARLDELGDRLDAALGETDLGASRTPVWAGAVRVVQWVLLLAALAGVLWLLALAGAGFLQLPEPPTPDVAGLPVPTLLLVGGVAAGVLLALLCRALVRGTARRRARAADRRLRESVDSVARELVVAPVEQELAAYTTVRSGIGRALR